jgi:hypothetical protein
VLEKNGPFCYGGARCSWSIYVFLPYLRFYLWSAYMTLLLCVCWYTAINFFLLFVLFQSQGNSSDSVMFNYCCVHVYIVVFRVRVFLFRVYILAMFVYSHLNRVRILRDSVRQTMQLSYANCTYVYLESFLRRMHELKANWQSLQISVHDSQEPR